MRGWKRLSLIHISAAAIYKLYGLEIELIGSNTVTGPSDGNGEVDGFSSYGKF